MLVGAAPSRQQYDDDPLTLAMRPPPNETEDERGRRLLEEEEAKRVSEGIDEELRQEKMARRRLSRRVTKILLLGQAESGKSTTIKNLQLMFQPTTFHDHGKAWRAVIHLNLINSVRYILDTLNEEEEEEAADAYRNRPSSSLTTVSAPVIVAGSSVSTSSASSTSTINITRPPIHISADLKRIRMRLLPLLRVGDELGVKLSPEYYDPQSNGMAKYSSTQSTSYPYNHNQSQTGAREVTVRSGSAWKAAFGGRPVTPQHARSGTSAEDEAARVLHACVDDIWSLWTDPVVKEVLKKRKVRLQEMSGFFLNDVNRIAGPSYEPTIDDIVRARLRTQGVDEYKFTMENRGGREWWVYDVGGSRTQRAQWAQFFDDITAIIFLAPISAFDEYLPTAEDQTRMNKLEDTFLLWKDVVSNRLLAKVTVILFMNKIDILNIKINQGVDVRKYVPRFEGDSRSPDEVTRYFRAKFKAIHKRYSPQPRPFHCFPTSAIDTQATAIILSTVREQIVRANLEQANIL